MVLVDIGTDLEVTQKFFRARPAAVPVNPAFSFYNPSTPTGTPEQRHSTPKGLRDSGVGPLLGTPGFEGAENKSWTAKGRTKAATSVALSPDGKFLAVGEV